MGFLSFLTKKAPQDRGLDTQLKGQAYQSTTASLPPIRGAFPVSGNGPNILNNLQQAARKRSQAHLSTASTTASAPGPLVPRLRSQSNSVASADIDVASLQSRPKSAGRRPRESTRTSSLLGWTSRRNSSHARSEADRDAYVLAPPVPRIPIRHQRDVSSSLGSVKRPAFVDLLDAQSDFKPADFRSRVQAAGVRDYGEDVADRNLGVNGVDLTSPAVKAFYALTGGAALAYRSDGSAVDVHGNMYASESIPTKLKDAAPVMDGAEDLGWDSREARRPNQKRRSEFLGSGTKKTGDPERRKRSATTKAGEPDALDTKANNRKSSISNRRNSLQDFMASTSLASTDARSKQRPLSLHQGVSSPIGDPATPPGIPRYRPRNKAPEQSNAAQTDRSRNIGAISKTKRRDDHGMSQAQEEPRIPRGRSSKTRTHRSGSISSTAAFDRDESSDEGDLNAAPFPGIGNSRHLTEHQNYSRPTTSQGAPRGDSNLPVRPSTSASMQGFARSRSTGGSSIHARSRLDDIIEHIPVRKSSLVPVNLNLLSPETSASGSSNQASQDDHRTANTSADLSYMSRISPNSRHKSSNAAGERGRSAYISTMDDELLAEVLAAHRRGKVASADRARSSQIYANNTGDDYLSPTTDGSDIDSFIEKHRRKRREAETVPHKSRAYKDLINGLPGLFDGLDSPASSQPRSRSKTSGRSPRERESTRSSKPIQAPVYQYSSDDQDSEFFSDDSRPSPRVLAALASNGGLDLFDLLDDMPDEKMDARTAVKLRREVKRQKRIASLSQGDRSHDKGKAKGKMPVRR